MTAAARAAIAAMRAKGFADGDILDVVEAMLAAAEPIIMVDAQAERRRAADRLRKADKASVLRNSAESAEIPPPKRPSELNSKPTEFNQNPHPPIVPPSPKNRGKGTRLSPDWQPTEADLAYAADEGVPAGEVGREIARFRDFWISKPGAGGVKLDWSATWRNWVRSACERRGWAPLAATQARAGPSEGVHISPVADPEAWAAWKAHRGGKSLPTDPKGGWTVPTKFPPNDILAALSAKPSHLQQKDAA